MPNTIAQNLTRLQNARTAIAKAITAKGGTVNSGDGYEEFVKDILTIPTAGSWQLYRDIVRLGCAPDLFPVGTILYDTWDDNTTTAFEVVAYDKHFDNDLTALGYTHSATLQELKLTLRQFDAPEAWLYLSYDGQPIVSGQAYRFTIPNYDASYGGNETYIFTATANVSKETSADAGDGGQLTLAWASQQNPTSVNAYEKNSSTTPLFGTNGATIAVWNGTDECINLGTIKLAMSDADSTYGKLNHIHRARYGSNNYHQSGLRQILNSSGVANTWWQAATIFDRPYGNRDSAGYLTTLNSDFKDVLATADITTVANNVFETTGFDNVGFTLNQPYAVKDKIFILSHTEVNLSLSPNVGSVLDYYVNADNTKRIKYRKDKNNAYYWWLRTPNPTYANVVRSVNTSGALHYYGAGNTFGSAAACIIQ